jgi:hypothetical protein
MGGQINSLLFRSRPNGPTAGTLGGDVVPIISPVANAGADASFDLLGALPYTLAGSATGDGPITYAWSKLSGTPVPTFADPTDPLSTVTFDVEGTVTLRLTATNAGGSSFDDVVITVTATLTALLARMASGSRVCEWWQTGLGSTDSGLGGTVQTLASQGNHPTWAPTQATGGNRPVYSATGGPLANGPCLQFSALTQRLTDTLISIAGGKALFLGAVIKGVAAGAARVQLSVRDGATEGAGNNVFNATDSATDLYVTSCMPNGGAEETATHTSPAHSTNWYHKTQRYAASVAPQCKINNAAVSPGYLTATGLAAGVEVMTIGNPTAAAGSWYLEYIFEAVGTTIGSACLSEEGAIRYLVNKLTGLA